MCLADTEIQMTPNTHIQPYFILGHPPLKEKQSGITSPEHLHSTPALSSLYTNPTSLNTQNHIPPHTSLLPSKPHHTPSTPPLTHLNRGGRPDVEAHILSGHKHPHSKERHSLHDAPGWGGLLVLVHTCEQMRGSILLIKTKKWYHVC